MLEQRILVSKKITKNMSYNRPQTISCNINADLDCSVDAAMAILAGKWKLKIYKAICLKGTLRFSEIRYYITQISDKTLTAQLREMEEDGLLGRVVYAQVPPRVEYHLTALGESLEAVFYALDRLGKDYIRNRNKTEDVRQMMLV